MTMPNRNCRPKSNNRKTTPAITIIITSRSDQLE